MPVDDKLLEVHADTPYYYTPTSVEILGSHDYLAEVEKGLERLEDLPALIVWGDRDIAFREVERTRFERAFPNHHTVVLRGAGHYVQEDAADEIVAQIMRWSGKVFHY